MKTIRLETIAVELSPFVRAAVNQETVEEYADLYRAGKTLPEPTVFVDDEGVIRLADGRHRISAAMLAKMETIKCDVRNGGYAEALQFACASNVEHGLRRTNADKRACVTAALMEWPKQSDRQVAELCAVDHKTVGSVRSDLQSKKPDSAGEFPHNKSVSVGTKLEKKEKLMPARLLPGGEVEHVTHQPLPAPAKSVAAAPHLIERVQALVREALRLSRTDRAFQEFVSHLLAFQKHVQGDLPGILEQVPSEPKKAKCTEAEARTFCASLGLPESDGEWFFNKMEGSAKNEKWQNGGRAVADCYATIRAWKLAGYMASQKRQNGNGAAPAKSHVTKQLDAELARIRRGQF